MSSSTAAAQLRPPPPRRRHLPLWEGPERSAPVPVLVAALLAGLLAATALPLDRPGIGWLLSGFAVTAAGLVAVRTRNDSLTPGRTDGVERGLWTAVSLALIGVGTVRASEWLFVLCVLTALGTSALALTGGCSFRRMLLSVFVNWGALFRGLGWLALGVRSVSKRVKDDDKAAQSTASAVRTFGLTVAVVVVFGALLTSADAAFDNLVSNLASGLPAWDANRLVSGLLGFLAVTALAGGVCFLLSKPPDMDTVSARLRADLPRRRVRHARVEWALPVCALVVLFTGFVAIQLTVLFGGREHVLRTAGLTAAEYARSGFWQLSAITVLTLLIIRWVARRASTETTADRIWLRVLLGALAVLTLVIVVSALLRMAAYQEAYGYTVLRVLVAVCELWLGLVYLMVLTAGVRLRAPWLPRAMVGTAVAALLALAAFNPEAYIAERNIERYATTGMLDVDYLGTLSTDILPGLSEAPPDVRERVLSELPTTDDSWYAWNLSRASR